MSPGDPTRPTISALLSFSSSGLFRVSKSFLEERTHDGYPVCSGDPDHVRSHTEANRSLPLADVR